MNMAVNTENRLNSVQVEKNNLLQLLQRTLTLPPYQRRYCWHCIELLNNTLKPV